MLGLIRFVAVFGGVAAGAQVAAGVVRGVKEMCQGHPGTGLLQVADGFAAPIVTACTEMSKFGKEVYDALRSPWTEDAKAQGQQRWHKPESADPFEAAVNGTASATAEG